MALDDVEKSTVLSFLDGTANPFGDYAPQSAEVGVCDHVSYPQLFGFGCAASFFGIKLLGLHVHSGVQSHGSEWILRSRPNARGPTFGT